MYIEGVHVGKSALLLAGALALSLMLVAACGGGDDEPAATSTPRPTSTATQPAPTATATTAAATATPTVVAPTATLPPSGDGDMVAAGQQLFLNVPDSVVPQALWCYQCHLIDSVDGAAGQIGPDLSHIATTASDRMPGVSAEDYIRESITDPAGFICPVARCTPGLMTDAVVGGLEDDEVEALVKFLLTLQ